MEPSQNQFNSSNVYVPDYGPMVAQPPENRWTKIKKWGRPLLIMAAIFGILYGLNIYKDSKTYQKPDSWVISQGLHSTLTKQQLLLDKAKDGQVSIDDLVRAATASSTVKAEAVKIGNDYLLSTGFDGKVEFEADPGEYGVEIIKIDGVDFTGVPGTININGGVNTLNIGLIKGKGKVIPSSRHPERSEGSQDSIGRSAPSRMTVSLFQDKNGNGIKDGNESDLPWAGVTLKLTKEN